MTEFDVTKHSLVPKHSLLSETAKEKLCAELNIVAPQLPKILITDPAIAKCGAKAGDVIKVERESPSAGKAIYYRVVINE